MAKYVISDLHLNHERILTFTQARPFATISDHNNTLLKNMIEVLNNGHKIYVLGDVYFHSDPAVLGPLKPYRDQLFLALGNHDTGFKLPFLMEVFHKVAVCFEMGDGILTHIPVHPSQLDERWKFNVHGHVHSNSLDDRRYINVSAEAVDYKPIEIDELIRSRK